MYIAELMVGYVEMSGLGGAASMVFQAWHCGGKRTFNPSAVFIEILTPKLRRTVLVHDRQLF